MATTSSAIVEALLAAAEPYNAQRHHQALALLDQWRIREGYYATMQTISVDPGLDIKIRLQAAIQLRRGCETHWRKGATNALTAAEKDAIRSKLLTQVIQSPDPRITAQYGVIIAKVARTDFPDIWPTLMGEVTPLLETHPAQMLTVVECILYELSSVRLLRFKPALYVASPKLFHMLHRMYLASLSWVDKIAQENPIVSSDDPFSPEDCLSLMSRSSMSLQCLERLAILGFQHPHESTEVQEIWQSSWKHLENFIGLYAQRKMSNAQKDYIIGLFNAFGNLQINMANDHPASFGNLPNTPDIVQGCWQGASAMRDKALSMTQITEKDRELLDVFCTNALRLLHRCFRVAFHPTHTFKSTGSRGQEESLRARDMIQANILSDDALLEIYRKLLQRFLVVLPVDIPTWRADPEEWETREENESREVDHSVRAGAEAIILEIALRDKKRVANWLVEFSKEAVDLGDLFYKDAVFAAVGISAPMISDHFNINDFVKEILIPELSNEQPNQSLLRRRVAILLGQWTVFFDQDTRRLSYQILHFLLDKRRLHNDLSVRIAAGKYLEAIVGDMKFDSEAFLPYAMPMVEAIIGLLRELQTAEIQVSLLSSLHELIQRLKIGEVRQMSDQIMSLLSDLWTEYEDMVWVQQSIIRILKDLVDSLGKHSNSIQRDIVPLIQRSLHTGTSLNIVMLEDCLELYHSLCIHATGPTPAELLKLVPTLLPMLDLPDHTDAALIIVRSLVLLAPTEMTGNEMRRPVINSLFPTIEKDEPGRVRKAVEILSLMIQTHQNGDEVFRTIVTQDLFSSQIWQHILTSIRINWESRQTTGPKRRDPAEDWKNERDYFSLLARVALVDPGALLSVIEDFSESKKEAFDVGMSRLLDQWFDGMETANVPVENKLSCMALTRLLEMGQPWILEKLQQLISFWIETVTQLAEDEETFSGDCLVYRDPPVLQLSEDPDSSRGQEEQEANSEFFIRRQFESGEEHRVHLLDHSDPVRTAEIQPFIRHYLMQAVAQAGGQASFQQSWLINVDKEIIQGFERLGIV